MEINIFELVRNASLMKISKSFDAKKRKLKDENGAYLSFYAAFRGKLEIFKYLLSQNVPTKGSDNNKNTILFYAIKGNDLEIIKLILEKNININQLNKMGASAVCYIDKDTKPEIVEYLIKKGLKINTKYKIVNRLNKKKYFKERNLLFYAIKSQNLKLIEFLISKKVNFSTSLFEQYDNSKKKMFFYILHYGNLKIIKLFIEANINTKLSKLDIKILVGKYIKEQNYILLKFIIDDLKYDIKGLKFGKDNRYNALTYAIKYQNYKMVKLLIDYGFETDEIDEYYYKPISYSAKYQSLEILKLLENTDLNYIIYPSETLFEIAAENKDKEMIKYLLYNNDVNFDFEFNYDVILDFGEQITLVSDIKNLLSGLIANDFTISYIKRIVKLGVKIHSVHILQAVYRKQVILLKFLLKEGRELDLLYENEIKTETILSFMIKKIDVKALLEVLEIAIKNNYLIYYVLKFEYRDVFKKLNLKSKDIIPKFKIKNKLLIPTESPLKKIKNSFILDYGNRLFKVYYNREINNFIFIDNNGIEYKSLPKASKKDNHSKTSRVISFFKKYKNFLID